MGRKLDALLGRTFKTSKFKALLNLAISRLAVLKNQRQVRCSQARSHVVKLLEIGQHERALLRVEQVIKEQNMLDVLVMVEGYCNLLIERMHLIEQHRVCPDELEEAASSLLFASSRCGDFPELQEIRAVLTSRFGKEFAARAIELRNNCGVNRKMIQKLSTRLPGLENRTKILKEIASENNIILQLNEVSPEERSDPKENESQPTPVSSGNSGGLKNGDIIPEELEKAEDLSGPTARKKYRDVADAAQAAFESAAYAAAAARAAFELSRAQGPAPDDQNSPDAGNENPSKGVNHPTSVAKSKNQDIDCEIQAEDRKQINDITEHRKSISSSSSGSMDLSLDEVDPAVLLQKEIVFDDSEDEDGIEQRQTKTQNLDGLKRTKFSEDVMDTGKNDVVRSEDLTEESGLTVLHNSYPKSGALGFHTTLKADQKSRYPTENAAEQTENQSAGLIDIEKGPISVRTRRVRGY